LIPHLYGKAEARPGANGHVTRLFPKGRCRGFRRGAAAGRRRAVGVFRRADKAAYQAPIVIRSPPDVRPFRCGGSRQRGAARRDRLSTSPATSAAASAPCCRARSSPRASSHPARPCHNCGDAGMGVRDRNDLLHVTVTEALAQAGRRVRRSAGSPPPAAERVDGRCWRSSSSRASGSGHIRDAGGPDHRRVWCGWHTAQGGGPDVLRQCIDHIGEATLVGQHAVHAAPRIGWRSCAGERAGQGDDRTAPAPSCKARTCRALDAADARAGARPSARQS